MDESLSYENLLKGAKKFAGLALQAHHDGDEEVLVLHAGLSIERLMKATLAKANPVLLMETAALKDDRALLHFAGLRLHGERVRTVSATSALARLRAAGWLPKDPELDDLIELRNGVVHLGPEDADSANVLATFGRTTNRLLTRLDLTTAQYWETWTQLIDITLNDQLERVDRDVKQRIEKARHRYANRIKGLPEEAVQLIRDKTAPRGILGFPTPQDGPIIFGRATCPVCKNLNAVVLLVAGRLGDATRIERRSAYAGYACSLCALALATIEQADAAGIDMIDIRVPDLPVSVMEAQIHEWFRKTWGKHIADLVPDPQTS